MLRQYYREGFFVGREYQDDVTTHGALEVNRIIPVDNVLTK